MNRDGSDAGGVATDTRDLKCHFEEAAIDVSS
jgi:hypothetical protein